MRPFHNNKYQFSNNECLFDFMFVPIRRCLHKQFCKHLRCSPGNCSNPANEIYRLLMRSALSTFVRFLLRLKVNNTEYTFDIESFIANNIFT